MPISIEVNKELPYHPSYAQLVRKMDFWHASFRGGPDYKKARDADGEPVFIRHPQESDEAAKYRLRVSTYRNYPKAIIKKFVAFVFGTSPVIRDQQNERFKEFAEDCDMLGTTLNDFVRRATQMASIESVRYAIMESSKLSSSVTKAQTAASGSRMFLIDVDPRRVVNWECDGPAMTSCLILFPETSQARLYTMDSVTVIEVDPKTKHVKGQSAPMPHGYLDRFGRPMIPVVRFHANDEQDSLIQDISEHSKKVFFLDGLVTEELGKQTFSQWVLAGVSKEEMEDAEVAFNARKFLCVNKADVKAQMIAADVSQAESIRDSMAEEVAEIYRLAGLSMPKAEASGAESGVALRIRFDDAEMLASGIADSAEKAENQVVDLWKSGMNDGGDVEYTQYPESFSTDDLASELKVALDILGADFTPSLKAMVKKKIAGLYNPEMTPQERNALEAEAMEQPEPVAPPTEEAEETEENEAA
jgi:hypothetical protein